ncbi:MAG: hypothetical protein JXR75_02345 [Rhodobacteraceae bacterium]|nr:hypothetical protein [Paracoccaceae bacterium]
MGLGCVALVSACDRQQVADSIGRKAAASVVLPVVQNAMPTPVAQKATDCIVRNATAAEVQALMRDVGVVAGTTTKANIRAIAIRPETAACFAASGVPPVLP